MGLSSPYDFVKFKDLLVGMYGCVLQHIACLCDIMFTIPKNYIRTYAQAVEEPQCAAIVGVVCCVWQFLIEDYGSTLICLNGGAFN